MCSSDYGFHDIVSAKLLSMIYMYLGLGKVGFCEMFVKRGILQKSGIERRNFRKIKALFSI